MYKLLRIKFDYFTRTKKETLLLQQNVIADDDEDDRFLIKAAFEECGSTIPLFFVQDGLELMQYLNNENAYADANVYKQPSLILLDLNMPKKDGREIIQEMRSNSN